MKLLTDISLINRQQWESLSDRSPVASVFQTPAFYDFYSQLGLYEISVVGVEEQGALMGLAVCLLQAEGKGLKKRLTTRAIVNGGPLLDENISNEALQSLLDSVVSGLKHRCVYIETRNLNDYSRWRSVFEACGFNYQPHYNFHIDTSEKEVEKRFDKSRRKRIRQSMERGAELDEDASGLPSFYEILSDLYNNKVHKPLPPYCLFEELLKNDLAKYFFVKSPDGKVIGGQLILMLGSRVAYAWYCCGLDQEYRDLHPSIMANYAAIRYAADNGFQRFDMMGAGAPGDGGYGVRDFKAQFGGTLVEHGRFLFTCRPLVYKMGKMVISVFSKQH